MDNKMNNILQLMNFEPKNEIDEFAKNDWLHKDTKYNDGLRAIRKYGYENVSGQECVKYYCMCNLL